MSEDFELNLRQLRERQGHIWSGKRRDRKRSQRSRVFHTGNSDGSEESRSDRLIEQNAFTSESAAESAPAGRRPLFFDPWRLIAAVRSQWLWLVAGLLAFGGGAFFLGFWKATYAVRVDLIRLDVPLLLASFQTSSDDSRPQPISFEATESYMKAPELLNAISLKSKAVSITPLQLANSVHLYPTRNPGVVTLELRRTGPVRASAQLANLYAEEMLDYMKKVQRDDAEMLDQFFKNQIVANQQELQKQEDLLTAFCKNNQVLDVEREAQSYLMQIEGIDSSRDAAQLDSEALDLQMRLARQHPGADKLQQARDQLAEMLKTKTDQHPDVIRQKLWIQRLERQSAQAKTEWRAAKSADYSGSLFGWNLETLASQRMILTNRLAELESLRAAARTNLSNMSEKAVQYAILKEGLQSLEHQHTLLVARERDAQLWAANVRGYYKIFAPATVENTGVARRWLAIAFLTLAGGFLGLVTSAGGVCLAELADSRIKTVADLERVTQLPALAALGDLTRMTPEEQVDWAFRTLTALRGKLNSVNGHSLVCGLISAHHGEGRTTWIRLLVSAATQRGLRVLTVATTRPSEAAPDSDAGPGALPTQALANVSQNMLAFPDEVSQRLNDPDAQPVIHIPLPGWVWNLERRKQWQAALNQWRRIENLVVLVELPPASQPESILLAENVPQIIWLASSGQAESGETRRFLETLHDARCRLVGAALNRQPNWLWKNRLARWTGLSLAMALAGGLALCPRAAESATNAIGPAVRLNSHESRDAAPNSGQSSDSSADGREPNLSFPAASQPPRAEWQKHLTLGPGDVLDISLYGQPELTRTNLVIGPDGRLSYWKAENLLATGLTVDELRAALDKLISQYYPASRTIIQPVAYNSKKYFVLGKVGVPGAYRLDQPMNVLEAVARARGLQTGLVEGAPADLADLSRSFLARNGRRMNINFQRLFLQGDLSQNVPLEPDDYLYFAPALFDRVYVLGWVARSGVIGWRADTTVLSALADAGGFLPKAYKARVLVVRGSLDQPETFIVNVGAILEAGRPDFKLQPRDIVYVSARPWAKVEDILDEAGQAFVQSAVTAWGGVHIGPIITRPFLTAP